MIVTLVRFRDWDCLYIDSELVYDNHVISLSDYIRVLNDNISGRIDQVQLKYASDDCSDALEYDGEPPENINDLEFK
jgi:hypothetical protein